MKAVCEICPRHCSLDEGETGFCRARTNVSGSVVCNSYGRITSLALDPIEKKPLRRFKPGKMILSVGSYGCNLRCPFCQNSEISMADSMAETVFISPDELVLRALKLRNRGNEGLAYTYNEPLIGYEYIMDCSQMAHEHGLVNVLVTNGCICEEPLEKLLPYIDAMNIDLKGADQKFYDLIGGSLETVKRFIAIAADKCHVELTTLIIPGKNDSEADMREIAKFISGIDRSIPLHISRFFPRFNYSHMSPTPVETVHKLRDIASELLYYVYTGNC